MKNPYKTTIYCILDDCLTFIHNFSNSYKKGIIPSSQKNNIKYVPTKNEKEKLFKTFSGKCEFCLEIYMRFS